MHQFAKITIEIFTWASIHGIYGKDITWSQVFPLTNTVLISLILGLDCGKIMSFRRVKLCEEVFAIMHNTQIVIFNF